MAGYQDWMNPNPQAAHTDRLLNDPRNPTILGSGSFQPNRETVDPRWNLPWQGNADFVTNMPNSDQREGFQYDVGIDGNTESFNFDEELTPEGMEAFRRRQGITPEVPQTQRPAKPVTRFPSGQSMNRTPIANNFMDRIKSMFGAGDGGWSTY